MKQFMKQHVRHIHQYSPEETPSVPHGERRIRDAYPTPKRRGTDTKMKCDHVSQIELDLLARIDGHIARIAAR